MNILKLFYRPNEAFASIKAKGSWVSSFLVVTILLVVIGYFMIPITKQVLSLMLYPENLTADQIASAKASADQFKYLGLIAIPFSLAFSVAIWGLFLFLGALICKCKVAFVKVFALVSTAYIFVVLDGALNMGLIYLKGIGSLTSEGNMYKTGLNLLFKVEEVGLPMYQVLASINPFQICYALALIFGLSKIADLKLSKSVLIYVFSWLIMTLFTFAIAVFRMSNN